MVDKELISIILPVYNREKFIAESIQSILYQTYQNFELIIVDDASTDDTVSIINKFEDSRIKFFQLKQNKGVSHALNLGFENAKGEYLARQDSDDVSIKDRFEIQTNFLNYNSEIDICGSGMKTLKKIKKFKYPRLHNDIITSLLIENPLASPTIIFRKKVHKKVKFDESLRFGEDYDFWSKALFLFKAHNLPDALVYYRFHQNQLSLRNKPKQIKDDLKLQLKLFQKLGYDQNFYKDGLIVKFLDRKFLNYEEFIRIYKWLNLLKKRNYKIEVFSQKEFLNKLNHFYEQLNQIFFFHPESSHRKIIQLRALTTLPVKKSLMIITKKIKVWMK